MAEQFKGWKTKAEAVKLTGISERTLERLVQRGELRQAYKHVPGRRPVAVLHPSDIEKLKRATVTPVPVPEPTTNGQAEESSQALATIPAKTAAADFLATLATLTNHNVSLKDKLFLTLPEAVELSGLPDAYLRRLIHEGSLKALKAGGYRIRRTDLQQL